VLRTCQSGAPLGACCGVKVAKIGCVQARCACSRHGLIDPVLIRDGLAFCAWERIADHAINAPDTCRW
jgi:hypothetical protein